MKPSEEGGDGGKAVNLRHLLLGSLAGIAAASVAAIAGKALRRSGECSMKDNRIVPLVERRESGHRLNIERFSHYVGRQLGFEDANECPQLCKLANAYLKKSKGYEEDIFEYLGNEAEADSLYILLIEEFERCILSYFAFNWTQASNIITQVLGDELDQKNPKFKDFVMAATRKLRFEKVTKDLKVTRVFSTLVAEMKAIGETTNCTEVMAPVSHSKRSPVLLLMGGGMGAGKSTVLQDILKESVFFPTPNPVSINLHFHTFIGSSVRMGRSFWSEAGANAVTVEADAFKETDVIYRALSSRGHHDDMLQTAELVHKSSTDAASSLLVTALNEGRDVIMDGTLSWEPFVEQTIEMARNVHKHRYRMGVGYKVTDDGSATEHYWEQIPPHEEETVRHGRKPYRIELVGVVCDAYLAVARGIRRAIMVKRAVRVNSQLRSHKRFANAFPKYCQLVDNARLYCSNPVGGPPRLIAWKDSESKLLVDPEDYDCLKRVSNLNPDADSIYDLYPNSSPIIKPGSVWNDVVLVPSRPKAQKELGTAIKRIEKALLKDGNYVN
ncbi:PREDICTED: uncharacterized protein LOC104801096 isoform X2 [Tarenaya hassleriana]|uniref:uncharacterized protein LOC104801096 isoform X2 n=1 Tax=Tarenaya hassleriana TaxID=28532 RepID=UPI00053C9650|nr:PREDICTED: uncharacterized protein LOC104801096 isoform X2 [Tarenaya hassleriana]